MKASIYKKVLLITFASLLVLTLLSFAVMYYQVNKAWGEFVPTVNSEQFRSEQGAYAILNASVLSQDGERMLANQTIIVRNGIIEALDEGLSVPEHVEVIDASGKFIIPGLIDAHVHLWQSPNDLLLYLANGVTHVRELNGSEEHLSWREDIAAGRPGPDLFVATRRHNTSTGFSALFDRWAAKINPVASTDNMSQHVASIQSAGYDAIKVYTLLDNDHFVALQDAAREANIQILGHIPFDLPLDQVWASDLKDLGHVEELVKALDREFGGYTRDDTEEFLQFVRDRSEAVAAELNNNDIAVVTTLALIESFSAQKLSVEDALSHVHAEYVNTGIAESLGDSFKVMGWLPESNIYRLPEDYPEDLIPGNQRYWNAYAEANQILLQAMVQQNVLILAGTDANVPIMVPGYSLHEELESLVAIGFTPAQALRSATTTTAQQMNIESGVIREGYQADLLILNANPLNNISHTKTIVEVISNGRRYTGEDIENMREAVRVANQG
ncbi:MULTISPECIES: amidohydrolase family protein [Gammaproteobacteria]|uniref:amidohydrolase family protein n=1 Tax=Gammaproteobacteria TaxID=1236 RepID=UPI000DD078CB|nr:MULTISPECIES: amidohydrolase family protein [Gammaproteobacteria]RTE86601.1 amidohydrolase [Aliidiomarina sp. B3213]TCZ90844.1 amidohydrolase [Lysobacter sp. N42]